MLMEGTGWLRGGSATCPLCDRGTQIGWRIKDGMGAGARPDARDVNATFFGLNRSDFGLIPAESADFADERRFLRVRTAWL